MSVKGLEGARALEPVSAWLRASVAWTARAKMLLHSYLAEHRVLGASSGRLERRRLATRNARNARTASFDLEYTSLAPISTEPKKKEAQP